MKTHYLSFILRLRLDDRYSEALAENKVSGSVQQVGHQEVFYFDSAEEFRKALQRLAAGLSITEVKNGNSE
jgi:hypothetical protein